MLRELNENEMEMVSGGTEGDGTPNPRPHLPPGTEAPTIWGDGVGTPDQGNSETYYNGHMYSSQGAADVARVRDGRLSDSYGNGSSSSSDTDPNSSLPIDSVSGISETNTGTAVGTVGGVEVGVTTSGGFPPSGGTITGSTTF